MELITGPVSYQKIVIPELGKIIHMFGDRHERTEECEHKSYLLEQVVENTIHRHPSIMIDVFFEEGYGSVFLNERMMIKRAEHALANYVPTEDDVQSWHEDVLWLEDVLSKKNAPFFLNNDMYINSFMNYFVNGADCFMKPREDTSCEAYPNARFHSIDLRDTLRTECIELLTDIRIHHPFLNSLFDNSDYQFNLFNEFNQLQTILQDYTGPKKDLADFIHKMISLRLTRFRKELEIDRAYQFQVEYPIGIDEYDFFEELAAVILDPSTDPSNLYFIKKLYKSISHVQDKSLHVPLKKLVDDTLERSRTLYASDLLKVSMAFLKYKGKQSFFIYKQSKSKEAEEEHLLKKKEFHDIDEAIMLITVPLLDLYALIRMMKSDYQHIIMYYGNDHTSNMMELLIQLFPRTIKISPLYFNNDDKQCILIPMRDGTLSFTTDVDEKQPFKYGFNMVPTKKAIQKEDESYPSERLEALRRVVDQKRRSMPYVPLPDENRMYHLKKMGKRTQRTRRNDTKSRVKKLHRRVMLK